MNLNANTNHQNVWDVIKTMLMGKSTREKHRIYSIKMHIVLEIRMRKKAKQVQKIIKMRAEINETETVEATEKIN